MDSLFNISAELLKLQELAEEFELTEEQSNQLEIKHNELGYKLKGYAHIISILDAQTENAYAEIERIKKFIDRKLKSSEHLRAALLQAVLLFGEETGPDRGIRKIEVDSHTFSTRRSKSIKIDDQSEIAEKWKTYDISIKNLTKESFSEICQFLDNQEGLIYSIHEKILKEPIADAIKNGEEINGAAQITKYSLTIK